MAAPRATRQGWRRKAPRAAVGPASVARLVLFIWSSFRRSRNARTDELIPAAPIAHAAAPAPTLRIAIAATGLLALTSADGPSRTPAQPSPFPRARRKGSGGITLSDVAKLAGVSAITISRALNTPDRVSPDTLQRVRDAVARTGYVPNLWPAAWLPTAAGWSRR